MRTELFLLTALFQNHGRWPYGMQGGRQWPHGDCDGVIRIVLCSLVVSDLTGR